MREVPISEYRFARPRGCAQDVVLNTRFQPLPKPKGRTDCEVEPLLRSRDSRDTLITAPRVPTWAAGQSVKVRVKHGLCASAQLRPASM
jgi:hypothetical protein